MSLNKKCFPCIPAHYQRRWVSVPLYYVPEEALHDDGIRQHELIILDDQQIVEAPHTRCSEAAYRHLSSGIKESILPERLSESELKKLCTENDIPVGWVSQKHQEKKIKKKETSGSSRRAKRKCLILDFKSYRKFIKELKGICKHSALVAQILWYLNRRLQEGDDYITIEEVLRLRIHDVDPDDGICSCITLSRSSVGGYHMVTHFLPNYIWNALCKEVRSDYLYVFSNNEGFPFLVQNVVRKFRAAGRKAGLGESVGSLSLRPIGKFKRPRKLSALKNVQEADESESICLSEISKEEWDVLSVCVPSIKSKLGRPSKYHPRDIINAFLYRNRTGTPWKKLPEMYPPASVVESQCRRWTKNGILREVLLARQRK